MNPVHVLILKAFLNALAQFGRNGLSLPDGRRLEINRVGKDLTNGQTRAASRLDGIARESSELNELYAGIYQALLEQYRTRQLKKAYTPDDEGYQDTLEPELVDNIMAASRVLTAPKPEEIAFDAIANIVACGGESLRSKPPHTQVEKPDWYFELI